MLLDDRCEEVEQESSDTAVGKSNGMVSKQPASTQILKEGQLSKFFHIITNVHYSVLFTIMYYTGNKFYLVFLQYSKSSQFSWFSYWHLQN